MENTNSNFEISFEDLIAKDIDFKLPTGDDSFVADITGETGKEPKEEEKPEEDKESTEEKPLEEEKNDSIEEKNPEIVKTVPDGIYTNMAKKLITEGKWSDVIIEIDGKEVKLSEATDIDQETFDQVYEAQELARKEELEENYVSVKGIDENKKKLINMIKNGADLKEVFADPSEIKRPFENVDLENEVTKKSIVFHQFRRQGLSEGEARELTEKAAKELTLDSKAESIVKAYQEAYDKNIAAKEAEIVKARKDEEEAVKEYRKTLAASYKEEGLTESFARKLVDAATKKDDTGTLVIDSIYEKLMEDPAKAKELIFFMLEPENFLKSRGATIKKQEQVGLMRTVKIIRDTAGKSSSKEEPKAETSNDVFSNLVLDGKQS